MKFSWPASSARAAEAPPRSRLQDSDRTVTHSLRRREQILRLKLSALTRTGLDTHAGQEQLPGDGLRKAEAEIV